MAPDNPFPASVGSGKTLQVRSWLSESWRVDSAVDARFVQPPTDTPGLDGWATLERLFTDLSSQGKPLWLAIVVPGQDQEPSAVALVSVGVAEQRAPKPEDADRAPELLTDSETRVLRYLPTHLPAPEIAEKLCLSVHTVRSHTMHVYEKLAVHSRTQAVERARALGLLAPAG